MATTILAATIVLIEAFKPEYHFSLSNCLIIFVATLIAVAYDLSRFFVNLNEIAKTDKDHSREICY